MVGIPNHVGKGACWISRLKSELVVKGVASELMAANLSNLFLSSFILSCIGENVGMSFFFDDANVLPASKWTRRFSSAFWPSQSNTLCVGFGTPPVRSFSCDPYGATDLGGRLDTISLLGLDGPALVFIFLLFGTAEWVELARN